MVNAWISLPSPIGKPRAQALLDALAPFQSLFLSRHLQFILGLYHPKQKLHNAPLYSLATVFPFNMKPETTWSEVDHTFRLLLAGALAGGIVRFSQLVCIFIDL